MVLISRIIKALIGSSQRQANRNQFQRRFQKSVFAAMFPKDWKEETFEETKTNGQFFLSHFSPNKELRMNVAS